MRTNALVRIALFSLAIMILLGILVGGMAFNYVFQRVDEITTYTEELEWIAEYDIDEISKIEIEWVAGDIRIIGGATNNKVMISESKVTNENYKMITSHKGSNLTIKHSNQKNTLFGINQTGIPKELVIVVPRGWHFDSIEIDAASSDIYFNDIQIGNADIETASGKCEMLYCGIVDLDIDTASGDIYFDGELTTLELDAASANGEFIISGFPESIDAEMASGDLIFVLPDDINFECDINVASGSYINEYPENHHGADHSRCEIQVNALSGDLTIMPHCKHTGHH